MDARVPRPRNRAESERLEGGRVERERDERARRLLDVVATLDVGEVTTYGDVAEVAGYPGRSRLVGRVLATTGEVVPWWRVVTASGRLVPGLEREQAAALRAEGVRVEADRVVRAPTGRFSRPRRTGPSMP